MRLAARLQAMGQKKYAGTTRISGKRHVWTGQIRLDNDALDIPKRWKRGRRIFVNSMSDLFHEDVDYDFVLKVFRVMRETPQHQYQVLTKRPERIREFEDNGIWSANVWMGVSVESEDYKHRIETLRNTGAQTKFLSLEPLIGPLGRLDLNGIDWVIAGGESGPDARVMRPEWVREIRDHCIAQNVPFHFKQWGGTNKKATGRTLDGRTWDEWPRPAVQRQASTSQQILL